MQLKDDADARLSSVTPETCTACAAQGLPCEGKTPCHKCQEDGVECSYNWRVGPHMFAVLPEATNLTDEIPLFSPFDLIGGQTDTYGTVYPVPTRAGQLVAVKATKEEDRKAYELKPFQMSLRAAWIWARMRHENILPLLGVASFPGLYTRGKVAFCLVSPWVEAGSVMEYLKLHPDAEATRFGWEVAKGVKYLHGLPWGPVVHGDLKGNNILITMNNDVPTARITDFGLSSLPARRGNSRLGGLSTTRDPRHMARERICLTDFGSRRGWEVETTASDVFELMRCILEIYTGNVPYQEITDEARLFNAVLDKENPQRPDCALIDDDMWALMTSSWSLTPGNRPNIGDIEAFLHKRLCFTREGIAVSSPSTPQALMV